MKMHWCTGKLNLSGQGFTINVYNEFNPISWPEAQVLMSLHGTDNVFELKPCKISDVHPRVEKDRLMAKYGFVPVERVFPGHTPRMEMLMPGEAEDQQQADADGITEPAHTNGTPTPPPDDEEDEEDTAKLAAGGAVMKPGRHTRPAAGG